MDGLAQLRKTDNLKRAWRWIQSNPDAGYKGYFRPLYQRFAVADAAIISDIQDRLRRNVYEPEPATKILFPKASGILRPHSLLSVSDQIVYQAAVNVIAEKLAPKVRSRYYKRVFGHLYAGKRSVWFYRKWSTGYAAFNKAIRQAVSEGLTYSASFDLTACYDSLDHRVLRHFLDRLELNHEFAMTLTDWLSVWTATQSNIIQGHGIPQGPLPSGLLAEVVLSYFDDLGGSRTDFQYFRYVDDIRLLARDERTLRKLLVMLDRKSKDVGLFPQGSKIDIHRITDVETELKSVSNPTEPTIKRHFVDQKRLLARLHELTPRHKVQNVTRFKYLLAHAEPSAKLTLRLWKVLDRQPALYRNVCRYLQRYKKLPRVAAQSVVKRIKVNDLYQSVRAEFIDAVDSRLPPAQDAELTKFLKGLWHPKSMQADLFVAVAHFLIRNKALTERQIRYACHAAPSGWARAELIAHAGSTLLAASIHDDILNSAIRDPASDAAISGAWVAFKRERKPKPPRRNWHPWSALLLREVGVIKRSTAKFCGVQHFLNKLDLRIAGVDWQKLLGPEHYPHAEKQMVAAASASNVNVTLFVNLLDVFDDRLLAALYQADGTIGTYTLGNIGGAVGSPTSRFAKKYPSTFRLATQIHEARLKSMASHAVVRQSGKPTGRIPFKFRGTVIRLLIGMSKEIAASGLVQ